MNCRIHDCTSTVTGPLRLCRTHYSMVPLPQKKALASYAKSHKGGPAHRASFERSVKSVEKTLDFHKTLVPAETPASMPYRDD